jgi:hypothetical protein
MLLTDYPFKDLVMSLKQKYKEVPPGWERELPVSMRLNPFMKK